MALKGTRAVLSGFAGAVGGIAFYRWVTRPRAVQEQVILAPGAVRAPAALPVVPEEPDPRAEALRAKLAKEEAQPPEPSGEPSTDPSPDPSPDERREQIRAAARSTVRAMRRSSDS